MLKQLNKLTGWASSRKGSKIVLIVWLAAIVIVSGIAPTAKNYSISAGEGSIHENTPSAIAKQIMDKHYPTDDGLPALVVFYKPDGINEEGRKEIVAFSEWISSSEKPENIGGTLPFHFLPENVQDQMFSENNTTFLYHFSMKKDLNTDEVHDSLEEIKQWISKNSTVGMQVEITGPAGIASDTLSLFRNADFVLLFATVGLILVLLLAIYRSPLLALIPLVVAALVYQMVDRVIGFAGQQGWFVIDSQALSIMMILLFAVLTDYCLFVFSRYREELKRVGDKFDAMKLAMSKVGEPILFSGGTILGSMLILFAAIFKPYHNFAPVFSIAVIFILLGGLTLIPAIFSLLGRKSFWPFVPKLETEEKVNKQGIWGKVASAVVKRPAIFASILLLIMLAASINATNMKYSFNLMKSFPDDLSSRIGFELLEENFPKGKLAPVHIVLTSEKEIIIDEPFLQNVTKLLEDINGVGGIDSISPQVTPEMAQADATLPRNFLSGDKHAIKFEVTLSDNPYDKEALQVVEALQKNKDQMLQDSGLGGGYFDYYVAGQTAEQLDVSNMNTRDMILIFSLIAGAIVIMLAFQTRSIWLSVLMTSTILLSYVATLGLGWLVFENILGYDAISYRIPVYTFIFLVTLGVDYNIMLVSRIREEAAKHEWKHAIQIALEKTGGVISSAGLILAATFAVLITQPMQELFLFGIIMAIGIIIDTFLVRGILLPSILAMKRKSSEN
ncbi:MMPL family transporter [Paenibacillus yanchengensis]|uniref:MMPL family transporter n=1 Tax=Paenibacillus yanchengensis TaxID=2035833 RepID=A0ABW4YND2_9BACL